MTQRYSYTALITVSIRIDPQALADRLCAHLTMPHPDWGRFPGALVDCVSGSHVQDSQESGTMLLDHIRARLGTEPLLCADGTDGSTLPALSSAGTAPAPVPDPAALAMGELWSRAASLLDQMFRGRHEPTRMQCVTLAEALRDAAPHVTTHNTGKLERYARVLLQTVNDDSQYSPRRGR